MIDTDVLDDLIKYAVVEDDEDMEMVREAANELAQLRNRIAELEARITWQPIETAPDKTKVLLLIQVIDGYAIEIATRTCLGEIGDQWSTAGGSYFHGTSLKMLAGWMPLPSAPTEEPPK